MRNRGQLSPNSSLIEFVVFLIAPSCPVVFLCNPTNKFKHLPYFINLHLHKMQLLFIYLPLPSLFVRYAHLSVMITLSCERGLLWLRLESLQSLTLRCGTNSFLLRDPIYELVSQVPLFVLSKLLSSLW